MYKNIQFGIHCEAFLHRTANDTSVSIAKDHLQIAIDYCESHELTHGYTSIMYDTNDDNIEIWYNTLKKSFTDLDKLSTNATQKEKNIALTKVRSILTITDKTGDITIVCPEGISIYPYNGKYLLWILVSIMILLLREIIIGYYKDFEKNV